MRRAGIRNEIAKVFCGISIAMRRALFVRGAIFLMNRPVLSSRLSAASNGAAIRSQQSSQPLSKLLSWLCLAASLSLLASMLNGCTNAMLASARTSIGSGNYAQAHEQLEAALQNPSLSGQERREVMDGLCTTENEIGAPTYSLWRQHTTCANAAKEGGNSSAQRLAKIDAAIKQQEQASFDQALHRGDLGEASSALRDYARVAADDTANISRMQRQLWTVVDRRDQTLRRHNKRHVHQVLAVLDEDYPGLHRMNQRAFRRWIGRDTSAAGVPMLSAIAISGHTLELKVPDDNLKQSAIAPEKFARINDAFSVWCQCDGATHVAVDSSGLPVYLARLNLQMSRSEVLVLPRP
jgi:hypothetical protein